MLPNVKLFHIQDKPWSDHFPLEILITIKYIEGQNPNLLPKKNWISANKISFQRRMNENLLIELNQTENLRFENYESIIFKSTPENRYKPLIKREKWFDNECDTERKKSFEALNSFRHSGSEEHREYYLQRNKLYKECCERKCKEYYRGLELKLDGVKDSKDWWDIVKELRSDSYHISQNITAIEFKNYFQTLLNLPIFSAIFEYAAPFNVDRNLDKDFEIEELQIVLNSCKPNKAPGENRIPYEFYVNATPIFLIELCKSYTKILNGEIFENSLLKSIIFPIHKKGELDNPRNYRGISFMNCDGKLFLNMINNRLTKWVTENKVLNEFQAGFRKGYSTSDNIYNLSSIVHLKFKKKECVYAFFVDFRAAFDSISRKALIYKLYNLGISTKIVQLIEKLYSNTSSAVWTGTSLSECFITESGVKQGCPLSPLLFALYLNDLHDSLNDGLRIGTTDIKVLMYADDIVLLTNSPAKLRNMIQSLERYCDLWNLTVNLDKSKILIFRENNVNARVRFFFKNDEIEIVNSYCYLGVTLTPQLSWAQNVKERIDKAKLSVNCTWNSFLSKTCVSLQAKLKLFLAVCIAILAYASQVWGYDQFEEVDKFQRYFVKRILNLPDNTPNYLLYYELNFVYAHYMTLKLHMEYIHKTLFLFDECRLPNFLSRQVLSAEVFWAKEWNQLGNPFDISWNSMNLDVNEWENKGIELFKQLLLADNISFNASIQNSQRFYKELITVNIPAYVNLNDRNKVMYIFKARSDLLVLNGTRFTRENPRNCTLCNLRELETTEHFIAKCPILSELRVFYLSKPFLNHVEFINALNSTDDPTWTKLYLYIIKAFEYRRDFINEHN